jgi:methionyl aminopeptidase
MEKAGSLLSDIFVKLESVVRPGVSTLELDQFIDNQLVLSGMVSKTKGYCGYKHASCISVNDVVVHGVPQSTIHVREGDIVKIDICASWQGYCADMARVFFVEPIAQEIKQFVATAYRALEKGIQKARAGNRISDISAAIQEEVERNGYGVVRDFAGHGIGKRMHEDPEVLNYGKPGTGPLLVPGMTLAIEPMITMGKFNVYIAHDGWTVKTVDHSLAAHVEDTVLITDGEPKVLTRYNGEYF